MAKVWCTNILYHKIMAQQNIDFDNVNGATFNGQSVSKIMIKIGSATTKEVWSEPVFGGQPPNAPRIVRGRSAIRKNMAHLMGFGSQTPYRDMMWDSVEEVGEVSGRHIKFYKANANGSNQISTQGNKYDPPHSYARDYYSYGGPLNPLAEPNGRALTWVQTLLWSLYSQPDMWRDKWADWQLESGKKYGISVRLANTNGQTGWSGIKWVSDLSGWGTTAPW